MSNRMRFVCWKFLRLILVASAAGRFPEVLPLSAVVGGYDNYLFPMGRHHNQRHHIFMSFSHFSVFYLLPFVKKIFSNYFCNLEILLAIVCINLWKTLHAHKFRSQMRIFFLSMISLLTTMFYWHETATREISMFVNSMTNSFTPRARSREGPRREVRNRWRGRRLRSPPHGRRPPVTVRCCPKGHRPRPRRSCLSLPLRLLVPDSV